MKHFTQTGPSCLAASMRMADIIDDKAYEGYVKMVNPILDMMQSCRNNRPLNPALEIAYKCWCDKYAVPERYKLICDEIFRDDHRDQLDLLLLPQGTGVALIVFEIRRLALTDEMGLEFVSDMSGHAVAYEDGMVLCSSVGSPGQPETIDDYFARHTTLFCRIHNFKVI